jgi:hypothetical protein
MSVEAYLASGSAIFLKFCDVTPCNLLNSMTSSVGKCVNSYTAPVSIDFNLKDLFSPVT